MILNKCLTAVIFCIAWINITFGASFSQVYVNSGTNGTPYQVVKYGAPGVAYSGPIAQLNAAPLGSVLPLTQTSSFLQPCADPCIQTQPAVVPGPNAGLLAYNAPVVVAGDTPSAYQYSYVVYDDTTGDQKKQQELSDGGTVRGLYSFLQPDGYVRQVEYTADDISGFNAIVNYLPANIVKPAEAKQTNPCDPPKSENIKEPEKPAEEKQPEEVPPLEVTVDNTKAPAPKEAKKEEPPNNEAPKEEQPKAEPSPTEDKKSPEQYEGEPAVVKEITPEKPVETAVVETVPGGQPSTPAIIAPNVIPLGYVSYDQLLNCLQKMQDLRANNPLTYVLLPPKPCI